jgi:hypothetical protein
MEDIRGSAYEIYLSNEDSSSGEENNWFYFEKELKELYKFNKKENHEKAFSF